MPKPITFLLLSLCLLVASGHASDTVGTQNTGKKSGVIFSNKYKHMTVKKAYDLQKAFVKNSVAKGADIVGFKAGVMVRAAYEQLGLAEPVTGVLMKAPLMAASHPVVKLNEAISLYLEPEFAYRIGQNIHQPVSEESVVGVIAAVAPAIELPDFTFTTKKFHGVDIIANNVFADQFILGEWSALSVARADQTTVSLSCNGERLTGGQGSDVFGGQMKALVWMINHLLAQGYSVQEGQILITGSIGKRIPASVCDYRADYGEFGSIEFRVEN